MIGLWNPIISQKTSEMRMSLRALRRLSLETQLGIRTSDGASPRLPLPARTLVRTMGHPSSVAFE